MTIYSKKYVLIISKKFILLSCAILIFCGSTLCLSYNRMMTSLIKQQHTTVSATMLNRLDYYFSDAENLLKHAKIRLLTRKENESNIISILTSLSNNKLNVSPWYYQNKKVLSYDKTFNKEEIENILNKTKPVKQDDNFLSAPYLNHQTGKYYAEYFVSAGMNSYIGYHIPLSALNRISQSKAETVKCFVLYRKNTITRQDKLSVNFDKSGKFLFKDFIDVKYNNVPYIGTAIKVSANNWYLITCSPKRAFIEHTVITTLLLSIIVFTVVFIAASLLHYLSREYRKKRRDPLTQAYTFTGFLQQFEKIYKYSGNLYDYCICQFDLHNFKMINESEGTEYGDMLLKRIHNVLQKNLPKHSIICRIHSDLFCICFPFQSKGHAQTMLEDISDQISDIHTSKVSVYYGLYICHANEPNLSSAVDYAGIALKQVKCSPLSNICYFEDYMLDNLSLEAGMEAEMYTALQEKHFKVYLQPKCSLENGCVIGAEALVRWEHPQKGMICPDVFIPLFEKNGFITKLDEYIWDETAALIAEWRDKQYPLIPISVNISRAQKLGYPLCRKFQLIIEKYHIPAHYLQLEFTESAFGDNADELYSTMQKLHDMGFTILMDDFGSGYSSLNMLKECSADIIKIDKGFLKDITAEDITDNGTILLQNIIQMLQKLNLGVVVEGVETQNHVNLLLECGCDTAQGYYYSPPLTIEEFIKFAFSEESPNRIA